MNKIFFLFLLIIPLSWAYYPGDIITNEVEINNLVNTTYPCFWDGTTLSIVYDSPPGDYSCDLIYDEDSLQGDNNLGGDGGSKWEDEEEINYTLPKKEKEDYSFLKSYCGNDNCESFEESGEWYCEIDCKIEEENITTPQIINTVEEPKSFNYQILIFIVLVVAIGVVIFIILRR